MGLKTGIEWTDHTWNPWQGCTMVSPTCTNCYMFSGMKRFGRDPETVVRSAPRTFQFPLQKIRHGRFAIDSGQRVFVCSWSDFFHQAADDWRNDAWDIIRTRDDVTFQLVTKRPERIAECLPANWPEAFRNVWMLITAENQKYLDERFPYLDRLDVIRGLSLEPLLGPIDLRKNLVEHRVDWVIVGGESGANARPTNPDWVRELRDQCDSRNIPFFFKQWGEFNEFGERVGRKNSGRTLDGQTWNDFPRGYRISPNPVMARVTRSHS